MIIIIAMYVASSNSAATIYYPENKAFTVFNHVQIGHMDHHIVPTKSSLHKHILSY